MNEVSYAHFPPFQNPMDTLKSCPWELAIQPFRVSPNTYYVSGQKWVSAYLVDTKDGLILIDCGVPESLYLLVSSVYSLGFDMKMIRKILISHAHFDHCGAAMAIRQLSGAEIYMSKQDNEFMSKAPDEVWYPELGNAVQFFAPDHVYAENKAITQGDISIFPVLTPGHTPGCTSFFWQESDKGGRTLTVAMHGGVGPDTMRREYYARSKVMTPDLRTRYIQTMEKLKKLEVDITLPSHLNQYDISGNKSYADNPKAYDNKTIWPQFIARHQAQAIELEKQDKRSSKNA